MKKITKILAVLAVFAVSTFVALSFTACVAADGIHVVIRPGGSGTRDAFQSSISLSDADAVGSVAQTNGNVLTAVAQNENAIGYVSGSSVDDSVKAVTVNNIAHTNANFPISRPFIVAHYHTVTLEPFAQLFWDFVISTTAQTIISNNLVGIPTAAGQPARVVFEVPAERPAGEQILVRGSSSVVGTMQALRADFMTRVNAVWTGADQVVVADIDIDGQGTGYGFGTAVGIAHPTNNVRTIGMASDALNAARTAISNQNHIAQDIIAIIVHPTNSINNLSMAQVLDIFNGTTQYWSDVA